LDAVSRRSPVERLWAEILASGTMALEPSVTVPLIVPLVWPLSRPGFPGDRAQLVADIKSIASTVKGAVPVATAKQIHAAIRSGYRHCVKSSGHAPIIS